MLCPVCDHTASRPVSGLIFPLAEQECQRCGSQWAPAHSRLSIAAFVIFCLTSAIILVFIDDSVYIHGNMSAVNGDDKLIATAMVLVAVVVGGWGLVSALFLLRSPEIRISRRATWPPSPNGVIPQAGKTLVESGAKSDERLNTKE